MAFESSLKVTGLEFPNFDGPVFWSCCQLSVLRMKSKGSDGTFVPFQLEFRRNLWEIQIFDIDDFVMSDRAFRDVFF